MLHHSQLITLHYYNYFMALWTLSGTTWVSQYQKVHFATQVDAPTIWMDCHPIQTNWSPYLYHPYHFYAGCPSWHNPPNLSWLGAGTKYAGLHTGWPINKWQEKIFCLL